MCISVQGERQPPAVIPDALPGRPRRLAAVVVNHQTPADTALAVKSLLASERRLDAIVVVDNDAAADLRERATAWARPVQLPAHRTEPRLRRRRERGRARRARRRRRRRAAGQQRRRGVGRAASAGSTQALQAAPDAGHRRTASARPRGSATVASAGIDYDTHTGRMRERHAGRRHDDVDTAPGERVAASGCVLLVARADVGARRAAGRALFLRLRGHRPLPARRGRGHPHRPGRRRAWRITRAAARWRPTSPRRFYFAAQQPPAAGARPSARAARWPGWRARSPCWR